MSADKTEKIDIADRYANVVQPIDIAGVTISNRIARSAHQTHMPAGFVDESLIAYHVARAQGGVGLTILETASIHPSSPIFLNMSTDAGVDGLARLADTVRPHGMKLFQQLWHGGSHTVFFDGTPTWSASPSPAQMAREIAPSVPIVMTKQMIDEVIEGFHQGAKRVVKAGLDGIEIHAAHGYLIAQFLSHVTNHRTDDYGGSPENRIRFLEEVLEAVRSAVDGDYPIGVRLSSTDFYDNGMGEDEIGWVLRRLTAKKLIDYVNLSVGDYRSTSLVIGTVFENRGYQLEHHAPTAKDITIPRLVTGRFITLDDAEHAIAAGRADLVSMVRATIAAPNLVNETLDGKRPRPCISCNTCVASVATGPLRCAINATQGLEINIADDEVTPTADNRKIVVAGGGPAGLEAARILANRGHHVTLVESNAELGGQLRVASQVPGREDVRPFIDWLVEHVQQSGVEIHCSTVMSANTLAELGTFDVFVNALGPRKRHEFFQFAIPTLCVENKGDISICDYLDVIRAPEQGDGRSAIILDDLGYGEGYGTALMLLRNGWTVHFVSRHVDVADQMQSTLYPKKVRRLLFESGDFHFHPYTFLRSINTQSVTIGSLDGTPEIERPAELIVPVIFGLPNHTADVIKGEGLPKEHYTIGEALSPHRGLRHSIAEGNRIGRSI